MNTKNQTNLIVIGKYERLKKKKKEKKKRKEKKRKEKKRKEKRNFPGLYAYQNVLLYTYLLHKPSLTHTLNVTLLRGLELGTLVL